MLRALVAAAWAAVVLAARPQDVDTRQGILTEGPGRARRFLSLAGLVCFVAVVREGYRFIRLTPRRIEIDDARLRLRFSWGPERVVELGDIREVRTTPELTLVLAFGEVVRFNWHKSVRAKLLSALEAALLLQPVPGDTSGSLLRPLLHPGEPIDPFPTEEIPLDGRPCPRCGRRYPSNYWFVVDGPTREAICRPCSERLSLERAEAALAATR